MIASLRGEIVERDPDVGVVIEVHGVGYRVQVTTRTLAQMAVGSTIYVHTHHHIREDAQVLYGFVSRSEREAFGVLIATHGIGPALALAVLSTYTPAELSEVVAAGDLGGLTMVPGVGKKTAERLLVELRNRLSIPVIDSGEDASGSGARTSVLSDVREALSGLGYGADEIKEALRSLTGAEHGARQGADAATLLREALTVLGKRRA
jgi:holliday junction DNA helicase RuvA